MEYSEPQETNQNAQVQEDERPLEEQLRDQVLYMKQAATPGQKSALVQHLDVITNNNRALLGNYLFGKPSSKDWTDAEIMVVWRYLRVAKDEDTSEFIPHPEAVKELKAMLKRAETEDGQLKMNLN